MAYIHNNPLKAGLVESASEYEYSSLTNYMTGNELVGFDEARKLFDISVENMLTIWLKEQTQIG